MHNGEYVFLTPDYELIPQDFQKKSDYPIAYPTTIRISAADRGYTLEGTYSSTSLFHYMDVFDEIPPVIRAIILLFFDRPVFFRLRGVFNGEVTFPDGESRTITLFGPYHYIVTK
jgi:hypothetical protein